MYLFKLGILSQSKEAKGKEIDATIGIALEDDKTPMRLNAINKHIDIDPDKIYPYAPSYGRKELRQVWKEMILSKNPSINGDISLPVVTKTDPLYR